MRGQRTYCLMCQNDNEYKVVWRRNGDIVTCKNCGFMQSLQNTSLSFDDVKGSNFPVFGKFLKTRHFQIAEFIEHKGIESVLEIGAGYGGFAFLSNFSSFKITCVEPDRQRSNFMKSIGLKSVFHSFDDLPPDTKFDAVLLDNVLEHVANPHEVIKTVNGHLKNGGMMLVIVPNRYDIRRLSGKWAQRHFWLPGDHLSYFRLKDLDKLVSQYGFEFYSDLHYGGIISRILKRIAANVGHTIFGISKVFVKKGSF